MSNDGIPEWAIAHLAHYSPLQQAMAIRWASNNLAPDQLAKYYEFAKYYRPAMRRDIQKLVDQLGQKLGRDATLFDEGMSKYVEGSSSNLGYFAGEGLGLFNAADMKQWADAVGGVVKAGAGAATDIAKSYGAWACATNPQCITGQPSGPNPAYSPQVSPVTSKNEEAPLPSSPMQGQSAEDRMYQQMMLQQQMMMQQQAAAAAAAAKPPVAASDNTMLYIAGAAGLAAIALLVGLK